MPLDMWQVFSLAVCRPYKPSWPCTALLGQKLVTLHLKPSALLAPFEVICLNLVLSRQRLF